MLSAMKCVRLYGNSGTFASQYSFADTRGVRMCPAANASVRKCAPKASVAVAWSSEPRRRAASTASLMAWTWFSR